MLSLTLKVPLTRQSQKRKWWLVAQLSGHLLPDLSLKGIFSEKVKVFEARFESRQTKHGISIEFLKLERTIRLEIHSCVAHNVGPLLWALTSQNFVNFLKKKLIGSTHMEPKLTFHFILCTTTAAKISPIRSTGEWD